MCKPNYFGNPENVEFGCHRECDAHKDCPIDKVCDKYRCKDPCIGAGCAYNALCTAVNHKAICMCPKSSTGNPYEECTSITTTSKITKDFDVDGLPQGGPVDLLADGLEYLPRLLAFLYRLLARGKYYIVCLSLSCLVYLSLYCMLVSLNIAKFSVSGL